MKVHAPGLAFLVDLIVRRGTRQAEVRVSYWHGQAKAVTHERTPDWAAGPDGVRVGSCRIEGDRCAGSSGGLVWDLLYRPGPRWLEPARAFSALAMADMQIASDPGARFDGTVGIGADIFEISAAPGLISHYWGRRLPDRWVWLSLTDGTRVVDAVVARTRLWGLPWPQVVMGYAHVSGPQGARTVISPLNGIVTADVHGETVRVRGRGLVAGLDLVATSPAQTRNDLGEGITQTLLGDLVVDGEVVHGVAGIETRGWP